MLEDIIWIVSELVATRWDEDSAFLWWFKVRQLAHAYGDCDSRATQWAQDFGLIRCHVPFCPRMKFIFVPDAEALVDLMHAMMKLTLLKRTAPLALPLPALRSQPLLQPLWLEDTTPAPGPTGTSFFCPPVDRMRVPASPSRASTFWSRTGTWYASRLHDWMAGTACLMRILDRDTMCLTMEVHSPVDLPILQSSFRNDWIFPALRCAISNVQVLSVRLNKQSLPSAPAELLIFPVIRMILQRRSAQPVTVMFMGAVWSKCEWHRKVFTSLRRTFERESHPFDIDVLCTHYGGRKNERRFRFHANVT